MKTQYDNRKLFQRMREIEDKKGPTFSTNRNDSIGDKITVYSVRKKGRDMRNIAKENMKLLDRLQDVKPTYDVTKWETDRTK
jgi:hypothetical protein